jgi:hypothetical protein
MEDKAIHKWQVMGADICLFSSAPSSSLYEYINGALKEDFYSSLSAIKGKISNDQGTDSEFCLCVFQGEKMYALVSNGASISLVRGAIETSLLKTLRGTSSVISGKIQADDLFKLYAGEKSVVFPERQKEEALSDGEDTQEFVPIERRQTLRQKGAQVIDRVLAKLPERKIIVKGGDEPKKRSRKASFIGIVFLGLLGVSIYFGMNKREENLARQAYEPELAAAEHDYSEALELFPISESRARELILKSRATAVRLQDEGVEDERLTALINSISSNLGEVAGIYDSPASMFLDLTIVASGFDPKDLALSDGTIRVLDSAGKRLVGIEVENKRTDIIAGSEYLPDALQTAAYADRSFVLSSDGVREVTGDVDLVIDSEWDSDKVLITAFAGNFYILDKGNNQIWRYPGVRGGFLEKDAWLGEGFTIDLGEAISWAIDGAIWTINENGEFKNYSLGAPTIFKVSGNSMPFSQVKAIYTDEESRFVYVLDSGNSRISVINKNGQYEGEYIAPELTNAIDLVVDEETGSILFLSDKKLYIIEANHLGEKNEEN